MSQNATIRAATPDDITSVQRIAGDTWRATYAGSISDPDIDQFLASAYSERSLLAALSRLGDGFVVAERNRELIGYAMAGVNRDGQPELYAIYVTPEDQESGAGRALWQAASEELARQGHRRMCCWVMTTNHRACRFYERRGAILTEEREFAVGSTMIREARYCVTLDAAA